ncbi:long-chain fatty acid transport protein 6 isoform X1 [Sciurus carolinensis]|uniref:long-chain fatty acid transport protein 6 isoform X1 n=1 Tax=Sciurus carolinensis TaxID=30640 RepID=UPI001FB28E54|nr:long-chain fatty acid transport protein 6 isoform X1 [Sciurus carolinensis]XP_047412038.1 long-chain fatty acid transport protein 6 isoform X1 [Sciurus carolinensis]XP_047412039.1 long-chain fatty acid transport protein 6 isoform X1 [Sciurus carolinensis]
MLLSWLTGLGTGMIFLHCVQRLLFPYFWDDFWFLLKVVRFGIQTAKYKRRGELVTVLDKFLSHAKRQPQKPFIIYEGDIYTYQDVDKRSNKVARVFLNHSSLEKGDTVALLMSNEPDFVHMWFGLAKLGCVVAFLNCNVRANSLLHCIRTCEPKALVVGADLLGIIEEILPNLPQNVSVWGMKDSVPQGVISLTQKLSTSSEEPVPRSHRIASNLKSTCLYIFTSGTTGLPKAAVISQLQALKGSAGLWAFGCTADDIVYITLPLYHSSGSLLGIGGCVELGATCVLKKKFSASQFWNDCKKYNVTVFQYIGELCRYLCKQPKRKGEKDHQVRLAVGNGIRSDVWRQFLDRFGNIKMCELYGATEGNICFMNHTGKIGSVGRTNFFYKLFFNFHLIKYDFQKDEPLRNEQDWCSQVKKGEPGLLISRVNKKNPFFGYAGSYRHTQNKLLFDVFKKGDVYFNTGDLMVQDQENFLYFWDRIGDTFRWKGENVATTEVADVIGMLDFIQEINVYGVAVSGYEGKAGMASIILKPNKSLDLEKIYEQVVTSLPAYACPRFLRIQEKMETTGTFKLQKFQLVEEGFNPLKISDPLYFMDNLKKSYVPLTIELYNQIMLGRIKL